MVYSIKANKYILVMYAYDTNSLIKEPLKNTILPENELTYNNMFKKLTVRVF